MVSNKRNAFDMRNQTKIDNTIITVEQYNQKVNEFDNHVATLNPNAHIIGNISGLQSALNGKEPIFTKNTAFNKAFGTTAGTVCEGNDARLSDSRTPTAHTHTKADITDLSGFTGSFTIVESVDFAGQTVTTKIVTVDNGIITSVI